MFLKFPKVKVPRQKLFSLMAVLMLPAAFVYTSYAISNRPLPKANDTESLETIVSVVLVEPTAHQARLRGHGEARSHYSLTLSAEVSGRITEVSPAFETGQKLDSQTVLATIDPVRYNQRVAAAKQSLAEAKLTLLQEQREAERAREEWQRADLGEQQASALVLRKPHVDAAQARYEEAQSSLTLAKHDLSRTQVRAPFESVVVERLVSLGQFVAEGESIAMLYSVDRVDVRFSLPIKQWSLLPPDEQLIGKEDVMLTSANGQQWKGVVTQVDKHIDSNSRQRSIVVSVFEPFSQSQPLLAGTFLNVEITGERHNDLLAIPASSLSSSGDIWYVTEANELANFSAEIVFQRDGDLFVKAPSSLFGRDFDKAVAVLTTPLSSYVSGQKVVPESVSEVGI